MPLDPRPFTRDEALQNRVLEIIQKAIPREEKRRVQQAVKQFNTAIRNLIRKETALKLSDNSASEEDDGADLLLQGSAQHPTSIPVEVVDGVPAVLATLIEQFGDPVLWLLFANRWRLKGAGDGLGFLLSNWGRLESWQSLPSAARGQRSTLLQAHDVVQVLLDLPAPVTIIDRIRGIRSDILGAYFFRVPRIEIYWMPIALFAGHLNVRTEDLAVVVLIHELAHGYTHLGRDINGDIWETDAFANSDDEVLEGLAQHYTDTLSKMLGSRCPGAHTAYERFLELQQGAYHAHLDWFADHAQPPSETVRASLLEARSRGQVHQGQWLNFLAQAGQRLQRGQHPRQKGGDPQTREALANQIAEQRARYDQEQNPAKKAHITMRIQRLQAELEALDDASQ